MSRVGTGLKCSVWCNFLHHPSARELLFGKRIIVYDIVRICRNTNVVIGGQSVPMWDYYLAPGVAKSFITNFCKLLDIRYDTKKEILDEIKEKMRNYMFGHGKRIINEDGKEFTRKLTKNLGIDFEYCWNKAYKMTERDTYQSQEAAIHNLNSMHCLPASEKIWILENNDLKLMSMEEIFENFAPNKFKVISLNKKTGICEFKFITHIKTSGKNRKIFNIETITGQKLRLTDNHKMMTLNNKAEIVEVFPHEIQNILSPRNISFPIPLNDINIEKYGEVYKSTRYKDNHIVMTNELAELMGIYCGDGSITSNDNSLTLTVCDKITEDYLSTLVKNAFNQEFCHTVHYYEKENGVQAIKEYCFSIGVRIGRMFKDLCGTGAHNKKIPSIIMFNTNEIKSSFIKGYLSTDGRNMRAYNEVVSVSENLSKEFQLMILSMQEVPTMNEKMFNNDFKKIKSNSIFYKTSIGNKASKRLGLDVVRETAFEIPKYDLSFIRTLFPKASFKRRQNNGAVRYSELEEYLDKTNNKEYEYLLNLFNIPIKFKNISNTENEETYDISVEDNETFLTRDCIIVHNSRAGSQVPFSSLNFGTDISEEGRMVSLNLLYATEAGLGNGETPIFP